MGGTCCTSRDRNDKVCGIEKRNIMNFYFNYPNIIQKIQNRLKMIEEESEPISSIDLNYLKWAYSQLQIEIDYNMRNLMMESKQKYPKRISIEICEGSNFPDIYKFQSFKTLVRLQFQNKQKKTNKNLNTSSPKFYQIFTFPLKQTPPYEIGIQVIYIDKKCEWLIVATKNLDCSQFEDQLVHEQKVKVPLLKQPQIIKSLAFKHKDEISEFSFEMNDKTINTKTSNQEEQNDDEIFGINSSFKQEQLKCLTNAEGFNENAKSLWASTKIDAYNEEIPEFNKPENYSDKSLSLNIRIQMINDAETYINQFIDEYRSLKEQARNLIEKKAPQTLCDEVFISNKAQQSNTQE